MNAPLLRMLALGSSSHEDLIHQIHYLTVENRILRSKLPKRVRLTRRERRRLLKFGKPVGEALKHIISIVQYSTFQRWIRGPGPKRWKNRSKAGRPPTRRDLKKLVIRTARTPGWGYSRIIGELRKLGVLSVSRSTVRTILKERGIESAPDRPEPVWDAFLKRHAATLWSCDFFTKDVLTINGIRRYTVLVFMHIKSGRVLVTKATASPTSEWASDAAACLVSMAERFNMPKPTILVRDNHPRFNTDFDNALRRDGIDPLPLPVRAPLMNAHIERWIKSLKVECLDHFIPVGATHLDYLVSEYVEHYQTERPHQGLGNRPHIEPRHSIPRGEIECRSRLGGLLRHYHRRAA